MYFEVNDMTFTKEKFDIVIQAGQSNSEGCGIGPLDEPVYSVDGDIMHLTPDFTVTVATVDGLENLFVTYLNKPFDISYANEHEKDGGTAADYSLTFAKEYKKAGYLKSGRKLLVIRAGVGGTGFMKKHWGMQDKVYLKMIEMIDYALSLNPENKLVAFLWHQGEHDAFEKNPPDTYEKQLEAMLNSVRNRYSVPTLPFVSADFVNEWKSKNIDICAPIIEKIKAVTKRAGGEFVETSDLPSNNQKIANGDDIHFCRQSIYELGRRYFTAFDKIMKR